MMQNAVNDHSEQESVDTSAQSLLITVVLERIDDDTPLSSEQAQSDLASDRRYSLIESRLNELHNGLQQANDTLKSLLEQNSTAKPPSRANQPHDPPQQSWYNEQPPNYAGNVGDQQHLQSMNTSVAHYRSHLVYEDCFYEPSQLQYLQQIAQMQEMINPPNLSYIDQSYYLPNPMPGYVPHQPNQINPSQFLPNPNQLPMITTNQMPELTRQVTAPSAAAPQRQEPPSYQDQRTVKLEPQSNPTPHVAERPVTSPEINQQVSNDRKNNSRTDLLAKLSLGPIRCIGMCADPAICLDSVTQATSGSQETQSKVPEQNVYQHPESKKLVADQATEMESDDHHDNGNSSPSESVERGYETSASDSEMVSADEELSDNVSTDGSDCVNEDYSEEDTLANMTDDERSMDAHNLRPEIQENSSEMAVDEMLEVHGVLLTKMYQNFVNTEEHLNELRVSTLGTLKLYETLLNKIESDICD